MLLALLATKNIRMELKLCFPGIKFSIKSQSFSMGNAVRVKWEDGPTEQQVSDIISKYEQGSFNGMTDSYEYSQDKFTKVYGGAKYVTLARSYTDLAFSKAINKVTSQWLREGDNIPTVEDYKNGNLWGVKFSGNYSQDASELIRESLTSTSFGDM